MNHRPIKDIKEKTNDLIVKLIVTAICLALAVEIWAFCLVALFNENIVILFILSIGFVIGAYLFYKIFFLNKAKTIRLRGIIAYEFINNEIKPIEIHGYSFNEKFNVVLESLILDTFISVDKKIWEKDFNSVLESLIPKNEKYIKIFNNEKNNEETVEKDYKYDPDISNKKNIINSILEYLILDKLTTHLDSYYDANEIDEEKRITITTNDFEEEKLENKIFSKNEVLKNITKGYFDINLPINSKITRNADKHLEISNKIFNITIIPDYQGLNERINPILANYEYLPDKQYPFYSIEIKLRIALKRPILFNNDYCEYRWLDSFLNEIYEFISIEHLNKKLNPDLLTHISSIVKEKYN